MTIKATTQFYSAPRREAFRTSLHKICHNRECGRPIINKSKWCNVCAGLLHSQKAQRFKEKAREVSARMQAQVDAMARDLGIDQDQPKLCPWCDEPMHLWLHNEQLAWICQDGFERCCVIVILQDDG